MNHRSLASVILMGFSTIAVYSGTAHAQLDPKDTHGYVISPLNPPDKNVVRSGTGLCVHTGYWTPAMAIEACDPDLIKKPPPPPVVAQAPAAPPPPPPPPAPMAPQVHKITLASRALFDFDKAILKPEGKSALDTEVIAKLPQVSKLELVLVTGHTDRIGTEAYNQKLSERRADAVRDYLAANGVPKEKIETLGMGKTQPLPDVKCEMKNRKELIACLAPNRRVEVEVKGEGVVSGK